MRRIRIFQGGKAMAPRTARRGIFTRRMGIFTALMGLISFALGFLLHPMY
jgi:hypothetical protein